MNIITLLDWLWFCIGFLRAAKPPCNCVRKLRILHAKYWKNVKKMEGGRVGGWKNTSDSLDRSFCWKQVITNRGKGVSQVIPWHFSYIVNPCFECFDTAVIAIEPLPLFFTFLCHWLHRAVSFGYTSKLLYFKVQK